MNGFSNAQMNGPMNGFSKEKYFYNRYANMLTRIKNLAKKFISITWRSLKTTPQKHGIYYAPFCLPTPLPPLLVL